jgi:hypothetical protein
MHAAFALILLASCEACDELAKAGVAHPFAIDASWRPKCDAAAARTIAADPWPKAGELRRDSFTRDCAQVELTRAFMAAPGGLADDELLAVSRIERKFGRGSTVIRQREFIGALGGASYRYAFSADGQKITGSVETPRITSHLVSTVLAPALRAKTSVQSVACELWRAQCEIVSRRVGGDVPLPYFTVRFATAHPEGMLCFDVPEGASVTVRADAALLIEGLSAERGSATACLSEASRSALDLMARARVIHYGAGGFEAELDGAGLGAALALGRFLLKSAVLAPRRAALADNLAREAEVLLDAPAVTN